MLQAFIEHVAVEGSQAEQVWASLRRVICSGEALPAELRDRVAKYLPQVQLENLYGPTEASIDVTRWACGGDQSAEVPIGRPIWNTQVYVLDGGLEPVPAGVVGRAVHRGRGSGARLSEPRRADGGAVCRRPERRGRQPDVPDRGPGAVAGRRRAGVPGPRRRAGEAARVPHRAGRDRGGAAAAAGRVAGRRDRAAGWRGWRSG